MGGGGGVVGVVCFFFQAEDGIRDRLVTGVQTCALPICDPDHPAHDRLFLSPHAAFYCEEGGEEFRTKGAKECLRALRGEALRNVVN